MYDKKKYVSIPEVCSQLDISNSTLNRQRMDEDFGFPHKIATVRGRVLFDKEEIAEQVEQRIEDCGC